MELIWHPGDSSSIQPTPASRLAILIAAVAVGWPELGKPTRDSETSEELAGPWESATWAWGPRQLRVVIYPSGYAIGAGTCLADWSFRVCRTDSFDPFFLGIDWLMKGEREVRK